MARINLLPWRAQRRKQREREFFMQLGAAFVAAVLVLMLWSFWMGARIDNQNERNAYLEGEIKAIDEKIDKITRLQDEQYLSILRLTIMSEEMPMSERLIAGKKYVNRGGNGDVKKALHKLEEQCEAGRHEAG